MGCITMFMGILAFVACENKSNVSGGGGGSEEGGSSSTSIVGTWKSVSGSEGICEYYGSLTLIFNNDSTGRYTYMEDKAITTEFDFKYTFNSSSNTGTLIPQTYYDEQNKMEFKVEWESKDRAKVYIKDTYAYYENQWELLSTFERQGGSQGSGESGQTDKMSKDLRCITGGVWSVGTQAHTLFIFAKNGHCRITYVNRNNHAEWENTGEWIYNEDKKQLITTVSDYSWDMNIISTYAMQGTKLGGGSTGFELDRMPCYWWRYEMIDLSALQGTWYYIGDTDTCKTSKNIDNRKIEITPSTITVYKDNTQTKYNYTLAIRDTLCSANSGFFQYDDYLDVYRPYIIDGYATHYNIYLEDNNNSQSKSRISYLTNNRLQIHGKLVDGVYLRNLNE